MGNTNLPQFGAAETDNSHDTLEGDQQLTPAQRTQCDAQARGGIESLLSDSVANESQRAVVHADHGKNVIGEPAEQAASGPESAVTSANLLPNAADRAALTGHVGTGHSASGAT